MKKVYIYMSFLILFLIVPESGAFVENWDYTQGPPLGTVSTWSKAYFNDTVMVRSGFSGGEVCVTQLGGAADSVYTNTIPTLTGPIIRLETSMFLGGENSHAYVGVQSSDTDWAHSPAAFMIHGKRFLFGIYDAAGGYHEDYNFDEYFHVKWWDVRVEIYPTANDGNGLLNFYYKEPGETIWSQSTVLSNLNLKLKSNPTMDVPAEWNRMFVRVSTSGTYWQDMAYLGAIEYTSVSEPTLPPPLVFVENFDYQAGVPLESVSAWDPQQSGSENKMEVVSSPPDTNYIIPLADCRYYRTPEALGYAMQGPIIQVELTAYAQSTNSFMFFGMGNLGFNSDAPGTAFMLKFAPGEIAIYDTVGTATVSSNYSQGVIYDILLGITPSANGGDGVLSLFYREHGEVDWIGDGILANINLHLKSDSATDNPATEWLAIWLRGCSAAPHTNNEARLYNITVQSVASLPKLYKATVPSPENDAPWVAIDSNLSWTAGDDAVYHDVYFGTTSDVNSMQFKVRTTNTNYAPGTLEEAKTYYWRVDERDANENLLAVGAVWSFLTQQPYPLMAGERFIYTTGGQTNGWPLGDNEGGGDGGYGWDGRWQGDGYCYAEIRPGSLEPAFYYPLGTYAEKLQHDNVNNAGWGGFEAWRRIARPINLSENKNYYVSFLVMAAETYSAEDFVEGDFQFRMDDGFTLGFAAGIMPIGWPIPGEPNLTQPEFYLRGVDGTTLAHEGTWAANTVYMVVLKISAVADGNDVVSMAVFSPDNPLPGEEPTDWLLSLDTGPSNESFNMLWVESQRADEWDQVAWDEIRMGFTWGSVTGWPSICGDPGTIFNYDLNGDCKVDFGDFATLAQEWTQCTLPGDVGCEKYFPGIAEPNNPDLIVFEASDPITVNGNLDDWADAQWFSVTNPVYQAEYCWDIEDARYAVAWDSTHPTTLYFAAKVKDVDHRFSSTIGAWNSGDQIELKIEANGTGTSSSPVGVYNFAQLYRVGYNGDGGSWACWSNSTPSSSPDSGMVYAARIDSVDADTILYEAAIRTYDNFGGFNSTTTTLKNLVNNGVIRFGVQVDSRSVLNSVVNSGAISDISGSDSTPSTWPEYTIKTSNSLSCGDWGNLPGDIDVNCKVGFSDLAAIAVKWLSCTDPENPVCDRPWLP